MGCQESHLRKMENQSPTPQIPSKNIHWPEDNVCNNDEVIFIPAKRDKTTKATFQMAKIEEVELEKEKTQRSESFVKKSSISIPSIHKTKNRQIVSIESKSNVKIQTEKEQSYAKKKTLRRIPDEDIEKVEQNSKVSFTERKENISSKQQHEPEKQTKKNQTLQKRKSISLGKQNDFKELKTD